MKAASEGFEKGKDWVSEKPLKGVAELHSGKVGEGSWSGRSHKRKPLQKRGFPLQGGRSKGGRERGLSHPTANGSEL